MAFASFAPINSAYAGCIRLCPLGRGVLILPCFMGRDDFLLFHRLKSHTASQLAQCGPRPQDGTHERQQAPHKV